MDDIVVKSAEVYSYVNDLRKVFVRGRQFKLGMKPLRCVFGVSY